MNRRTIILGAPLMPFIIGACARVNVQKTGEYAFEFRSYVDPANPDGVEFVRLRYDGTVEYSGSPDAASKLFWDALKKYVQVVPSVGKCHQLDIRYIKGEARDSSNTVASSATRSGPTHAAEWKARKEAKP